MQLPDSKFYNIKKKHNKIFTVKDLVSNERKILERKVYEEIYQACVAKIRKCFDNKMDSCIYKPPTGIIGGISGYSMIECIQYLIEKLREGKFIVAVDEKYNILISWGKYSEFIRRCKVSNFLQNEVKNSSNIINYLRRLTISKTQNGNYSDSDDDLDMMYNDFEDDVSNRNTENNDDDNDNDYFGEIQNEYYNDNIKLKRWPGFNYKKLKIQ